MQLAGEHEGHARDVKAQRRRSPGDRGGRTRRGGARRSAHAREHAPSRAATRPSPRTPRAADLAAAERAVAPLRVQEVALGEEVLERPGSGAWLAGRIRRATERSADGATVRRVAHRLVRLESHPRVVVQQVPERARDPHGEPVSDVEAEPDYLVDDLDALERAGAVPNVFGVRANLPPQPAHYRLLCRIDCEWPRGFVPFRDARLVPYGSREAA